MLLANQAAIIAPSLVWALPFTLMLAAIALLPLFHRTQHWWEKNRFKLLVSVLLAGITLLYYQYRGFGYFHQGHQGEPGTPALLTVLHHSLVLDYFPFITLLFALFTITGGVQWKLYFPPTPFVNSCILLIGSLLASFIGTTGASMLLIRPFLAINAQRKYRAHGVVFFIFLVSNIGGTLLPLGDPPLFLGYLRGVPFLWTLQYWPEWIFSILVLTVVFFLLDTVLYRREPTVPSAPHFVGSRIRINGRINYLWLFLVVLSVVVLVPDKVLIGTNWVIPHQLREGVLILLTILSWFTTPKGIRAENQFSFAPILEVAALFIGIFICMQPPMEILQHEGAKLGLTHSWQFFWACGMLSSFLDNAPTYAVFFETAGALTPAGMNLLGGVDTATGNIPIPLLEAVSLGAVLMGANTYIGNGPNFMVKSIAEAHQVKMPGFFAYFLYALVFLFPLYVLVTIYFLK